ncbi:RHS repeat protein, partial [bacterium CPR1]|nr:RHS repeat protein [bacterium CPR1]
MVSQVLQGGARECKVSPVPSQFWTYVQDELGRTTNVNNPRGASSRIELDPANNVLEALNYNDQRSQYTYDESRNPLTAKDALNHTTTFTWNNNNLTSVRDADGEMTFLVYDANNNLTRQRDPLSHTQEYDYNAFGQLTSYTDGEGQSWTLGYNSDGYLTSMTAPSIAGQGNSTWTYSVDSLGRRTAVTDPRGNIYRYEWDARDRLKSVTLPAVSSGGEQLTLSAKKIVYQWDRNDQLLTVKDPLNRETTYQYDSSLRLTSVLEPGLSTPTRYGYDAN